MAAAKRALRILARRILALDAELEALMRDLDVLTQALARACARAMASASTEPLYFWLLSAINLSGFAQKRHLPPFAVPTQWRPAPATDGITR
ncbi:hypothetical protein [Synechococcus sp. EJ6-Ellesmere]|uniref:hypothetical protein n=1 Tax=Synechococcus sp. EJ6-Ellesmere TaxID=2823734 RepID=UPI0020CCB70F|nr:hypothetical protein [Synechococcus sp. EJ6-Ellesmere]